MPRRFNYSGANLGKSPQGNSAQQYLREKAALMAAEKYYTAEEFERKRKWPGVVSTACEEGIWL